MRISDWSSDVCSSDLNKPGAQGIIGVKAAVDSPPDGYTLVMLGVTTGASNVTLFKKLPYDPLRDLTPIGMRSEEHTSELQSLMRISYAVFCLKKKTSNKNNKLSNVPILSNKNYKDYKLTLAQQT